MSGNNYLNKAVPLPKGLNTKSILNLIECNESLQHQETFSSPSR